MFDVLVMVFSVLAAVAGYLWRRKAVKTIQLAENPTKKMKRSKRLATLLVILGAYVLAGQILQLIFGKPAPEGIDVSLAAPRVELFGFSLSTSIVFSWCIMAVLVLAALILRLTLIPRLKYVPKGTQNVLELAVETITKYTKNTAHGTGEFMASYIFTIAVFLVSCAFVELLGLRTPASDITLTAALALITFFFINFYGFKVKGFVGRFKIMVSPSPFILPVRLMADLAAPLSLACRLFGNMLGGLVVVDLLYVSLGNFAIGIPSLLGLFFSVFHPLIQAFIFVTLTLSYINEVTE